MTTVSNQTEFDKVYDNVTNKGIPRTEPQRCKNSIVPCSWFLRSGGLRNSPNGASQHSPGQSLDPAFLSRRDRDVAPGWPYPTRI